MTFVGIWLSSSWSAETAGCFPLIVKESSGNSGGGDGGGGGAKRGCRGEEAEEEDGKKIIRNLQII